jgi:hypothetical protein
MGRAIAVRGIHPMIEHARGAAMGEPDHPMIPLMTWSRVVEIAKETELICRERHQDVDPQLVLRLAHAVLEFQRGLLGRNGGRNR